MRYNKITVDIALIGMFTALITICSWISFPFLGIPASLQTFAIFITTNVLGAKKGTMSVLVYILLGIIGVPVFSGFKSGPSAIFSATGGYIIGFAFAVFVAGLLIKKLPDKNWAKAVSMGIGQIICYISGVIWYSLVFVKNDNVNLALTFSLCVAPFILPDIIKIVAALFLSNAVRRVLKKQNIDID